MTATDTPETRLVHIARDSARYDGLVNIPVQRGSSVLFKDSAALSAAGKRWDSVPYYGRHGTTPTFAFEAALAELHGGYRSVAVCSGAAAVATALSALVSSGDHVLMSDAAYGPTRHFCDGALKKFGVSTTYYAPGQPATSLEALVQDNTRVIYLESPGSLTFEIEDIRGIVAIARARGIKTLSDNTWATPLYCRPISLGVDGVIESVTKYIGGHSDLLLGAVIGTEETYPLFKKTAALYGQHAAPDDVFLSLRGLRTLSVRLEQQSRTALELAQWLETAPQIARVLHPALPSHPQHALWQRDYTGASAVFTIVLKPGYKAAVLVDTLRLFGIGYSWGGFESLAVPVQLSGLRSCSSPLEGALVRLSIGLDAFADLKADLAQALAAL